MSMHYLLFRNDVFKISKPLMKSDVRYLALFGRAYSIDSRDDKLNRKIIHHLNNLSANDRAPNQTNNDRSLDKPLDKQPMSIRKRIVHAIDKKLSVLTYRRRTDEFYKRLDRITDLDVILVYNDSKLKLFRLLTWLNMLIWPVLIWILFSKYYRGEELGDEDVFDAEKMEWYHLTMMVTFYVAFLAVIYLNISRVVCRAYYNGKTNKFILIQNRTPIGAGTKNVVDAGQVTLVPQSFIRRLLRVNIQLPNRKKLTVDETKFVKPLYSNLLFGYTKNRRTGTRIY